MDGYCNFCGEDTPWLSTTAMGQAICGACMAKYNMCEICGSIRAADETADTQLHYKDLCFK